MGLRYLLDTNIVSELVGYPKGVVAQRIAQVGEERICTSIVVSAELRFGTEKSGSKKLRAQLGAILSALEILPLERPVDRHYAELRHYLEQRGTPIGPNDILIAAHALSLGLTVVTASLKEFSRVPGLALENWLED